MRADADVQDAVRRGALDDADDLDGAFGGRRLENELGADAEASRRVEARAMRTGEGHDDGGGGDVESERAAEKVRAEAERLLVELKK